jgi:hypothetical protein
MEAISVQQEKDYVGARKYLFAAKGTLDGKQH